MKLEDIVARTKDLLPNPQILCSLLAVLGDENASADDIVKLVKVDPGLTAKVISISNGAFYGFSDSCSALDEAIGRIGFQELYKLVSLCVCRSVGGKPVPNYYLDEGALWENAVTTAVTLEHLAERFGLAPGLAYTVGLLHSLGKFVINQFEGGVYEAVYTEVEKNHLTLIDAERKVLGFDHAQACSQLLKSWDYPDAVRLPIHYQYAPAEAEEYVQLTYLLHFTKFLVASVGCNFGRDAFAVELDDHTLEALNIAEEELNLFALETHANLEGIRELLDAV